MSGNEFKRRNGLFKLTMLADSEIGLPYGSIPRILIAWITTEAVRTKDKEISLGHTLSEFMSKLDLIPTGGRWGSITLLREQMKRLFTAAISCSYDDGEYWAMKNVQPVSKAELWWEPKQLTQSSLWQSKITLGEEFFNEAITNPIPIDLRALKALKRSPMAIDIYCWLTYRMSYVKKKTLISWTALETQFGSDYERTRDFKKKFLGQLRAVLAVYPEAKIEDADTHVALHPSKPHIPLLLS